VRLALVLLVAASALASEPKKIGRAVLTFYWTIDESDYEGKESSTLRDRRGKVIAKVTPRFRRDLIMQGAGVLRDGRTVVYYGKVSGDRRFMTTRSKYGIGSTGCPLIPHRTIAVDPHWVKLGSRLYIPQLKGAELPDGTIHDGMFIASDRGQFRGAHIDLFAGDGPKGARPFTRKGYRSRSKVTVYVDGKADDCRP
jgi:3D (Asp-Asp-Asp) domain-containing protein